MDKRNDIEEIDSIEEIDDSEELIDFSIFYRELTPEEEAKRIEENNRKIQEKGFLPVSEDYDERMQVSQEMVEANPIRFIIPECIPACKELWKKNIYTFMVSDYANEDICWIEIIADSLSEENLKIYEEISDEEAEKFSYHEGTINFGVKCVGKEAQIRLLELAQRFQMQDVPEVQAYIYPKEFLMKFCNCFVEVDNPAYKEMKSPFEVDLSEEEMYRYNREYIAWMGSLESQKTIRKFAPEKVDRPLEELVAEKGMILEDGKIYLSKFNYEKHKKYLEYINNSTKGTK